MDLKDLLMLVQAGYTKDEIVSMTNVEAEKKKEQELDHVKNPEPEKKSEPEKKPDFDYDKLADTIISKIQDSNRSANLTSGKNDKADWLNQLSLKF